ncbi:hypothetical protein V490_00194 [Pseudogymnoascus sp. VKM F-3557]|nr:hypothetical protein V490_00194 [Pseudogymnoascus sp. VKM F-3557]
MANNPILNSAVEPLLSLYSALSTSDIPPSAMFLVEALEPFNESIGFLSNEADLKPLGKFEHLKLLFSQLGKEITHCEAAINENRFNWEILSAQLSPRTKEIGIFVSAIGVELDPRRIANTSISLGLEDSLREINNKLHNIMEQELEIIRGRVQDSDSTETVKKRRQTVEDLGKRINLLEKERAALQQCFDIFISAGKKVLLAETTELQLVRTRSAQTSYSELGVGTSIGPAGRESIGYKDIEEATDPHPVAVITSPDPRDHLDNATTGEGGTGNPSKPSHILDISTPSGGRQLFGLPPSVHTTINAVTTGKGVQIVGFFTDEELQNLTAPAKNSGSTDSLEQKISRVTVQSPGTKRAPFNTRSDNAAGTGGIHIENMKIGPGGVHIDIRTPTGIVQGSSSNDAECREFLNNREASQKFEKKYGAGRSLVDSDDTAELPRSDHMPANRPDQSRESLLRAIKNGDEEEAMLLLENDVDPNSKDNWGCALIFAIKSENETIAMELLRRGADANSKDNWGCALIFAIKSENETIAMELLRRGADANSKDNWGCALIFAIKSGNETIAMELLQRGADANSKDNWGCALIFAIKSGNETVVKELLRRGADANSKDNWGCALEYAQHYGLKEAVNLLGGGGVRPVPVLSNFLKSAK